VKPEALREAIRTLLFTHPSISISPKGHTAHAERYVTTRSLPIGFEPARVRHQNIWVRSDSVRLGRLSDIRHVLHDHRMFGASKPNHDLFGEPTFKDTDVTCFHVTDLWQAVRVIVEVAGEGV
jgi:hypothetical protein